MPRGKNHTGPMIHACGIPYRTVSVDAEANCILCTCEGWLPIPVGKVYDFDTIESVFASPLARMIQQDVDHKKFTWCAIEHCGVLHGPIHVKELNLNINIDFSCNLACPSCRRDPIMLTSGPEYDQKINVINHILIWLEKCQQPINVSLGGSGDALASLIIRNLIKNYRYKPTQKFFIGTNGLLLKKVMPDSAMQASVACYNISVDAGSKEVYENVRRPGKWEVLLDNLDWLAAHKGNSTANLSFVLQNSNYRDLMAFGNLCAKYNFRGSVQPLNDWGTWNSKPVVNPDTWTIANGTYLDHDVANVAHENHQDFVITLKQVVKHPHLIFNRFFDKFL